MQSKKTEKNGFITIMVVGHFWGGFEGQNFILDIFLLSIFQYLKKEYQK